VPSVYTKVELVITDAAGVVHFSRMIDNTGQYDLPLEGLAAGVYHVCLYYGVNSECTRLIAIE
jgi:hypothetical protein